MAGHDPAICRDPKVDATQADFAVSRA